MQNLRNQQVIFPTGYDGIPGEMREFSSSENRGETAVGEKENGDPDDKLMLGFLRDVFSAKSS